MSTAFDNETGPPLALNLNLNPSSAPPPTVFVPQQPDELHEPQPHAIEQKDFWERVLVSVATQSWLASMAFHMALMIVLALILGTIHAANKLGSGKMFDAVDELASNEPEITHFDIGNAPVEPTELTPETLELSTPPTIEAQHNDNSPEFEAAGGGLVNGTTLLGGTGGFTAALGVGPMLNQSGVDTSAGLG